MPRLWRGVLIAAVVATSLGACDRATRVVAPVNTAPVPTSPATAVRLFEWAIANRDVDVIGTLLTEDMVFVTAGLDSAGNPTREPKDRAWVLAALRSLLLGVPGQHEPADVHLAFDRNLIPFSDPRPGHVDSLFKTIRTSVDLRVGIEDGTTFEVTGYALIYLVRGDTAAIPAELKDRGFTKDRNRWWISRWEDETTGGAGAPRASARGMNNATFGSILEMYWRRLFP